MSKYALSEENLKNVKERRNYKIQLWSMIPGKTRIFPISNLGGPGIEEHIDLYLFINTDLPSTVPGENLNLYFNRWKDEIFTRMRDQMEIKSYLDFFVSLNQAAVYSETAKDSDLVWCAMVDEVLEQAKETGTLEKIDFDQFLDREWTLRFISFFNNPVLKENLRLRELAAAASE